MAIGTVTKETLAIIPLFSFHTHVRYCSLALAPFLLLS